MTEPWELGIAEAAALIRTRRLSAVELLDSVLERLRSTEEYAHAWAHVDAEGATAAARAADAQTSNGRIPGPLHGIPLGIKDVIDVRGLPTEGGSAALKGNVATADAGVVRRLRRNGAVILGKTVTYEFAFGQGSPPTRNPWAPGRYAGGSSIGSGVAVAVGSAPGALGTDTGGSVRNPAAVNGLVGLKPTRSLVDGSGVLNISHTLDHIGPITRSVVDCAVLLDGMLDDAAAVRMGGPLAGQIQGPVEPIRVAVDRAMWSQWGVAPEVRSVLEGALAVLGGLGAEVIDVSIPELAMALPASLAISLSEAVSHHQQRLRRDPQAYLQGTRIMIETGALISAEDIRLARDVRGYLRESLSGVMDSRGIDILVSPTLPAIAPLASAMSQELTGDASQDSLAGALKMLSCANLTGMPAASVPCGFTSGQPVGMHLMGREFDDARVLAVAHAYEDATSWRGQVPVKELPSPASAR
ncbi:amidase [Arthrobacter sp. I2-34]|uniref:Amidase n=1 Tax=Arthrobacter hankyongi TaxID=2904801 RepID=A0ABS9L783_9MICC|nr:amidase [Arthrobacter hankyongi]MCG2622545.1 amidase [Arthrobacter hankyongi]